MLATPWIRPWWCLADVSSVCPSSEQTPTAVCSDEGLTLETSAKHHIPQATNIPYQPLFIKPIFSVLVHAEKQFFSKLVRFHIFWLSKLSRNGERKPINNYSCCIKTHSNTWARSNADLVTFGCFVGKNNLRRTMKYFDAVEKIHASANVNQKIDFHRPYQYVVINGPLVVIQSTLQRGEIWHYINLKSFK